MAIAVRKKLKPRNAADVAAFLSLAAPLQPVLSLRG